MKELSFQKMEEIQGGRGYWACQIGMGAVGVFWSGVAGAVTAPAGGIGGVIVGAAWVGIMGYVCRRFT